MEELVSDRGRRMSRGRKQKRRRQKRERSLKSRKMTKGEHEVPESSTRGNPGLRARGTPGPCGVNRGGCSPMCRTPCCSHLFTSALISFNALAEPFPCSRTGPYHVLRPDPLIELLVSEHLHLNRALPKSQAFLMGVLRYLGCIVITYVWV